ncbi:MAG: hypothetical protein E4H14_09510 [Candidatus Thorarchaeota archaeon]|nr:MAG: hypothetical protein E4H14_09510 [Candidatus Thorarchaeota archaeon]
MAEQFLSRLNKMEESINQLGETLKRMITILGTVTEIKSEVRGAKDEILQALANKPATTSSTAASVDNTDEYAKMVVQEVGAVRVFVQESIESLKKDMMGLLNEMFTTFEEAISAQTPVAPAPAPAPQPVSKPNPVVQAPAPVPEPEPTPAPTPAPVETLYEPAPEFGSSLPLDRAMKIADQLEIVLNSLKMGCIAGEVLDIMTEAKAEILRVVPSDPIMVKMDKGVGTVSAYPKRKELQARDILKLKKYLKDEIPKYRPA